MPVWASTAASGANFFARSTRTVPPSAVMVVTGAVDSGVPAFRPGRLQRGSDGICSHRRSVMEEGIRAKREPPREPVGRGIPAGSQPRLQVALGIGVNQGLGHLQAREEASAVDGSRL